MSWEKWKEWRYKEYDDIHDRTPKCHCELAGEGIEYAWGCAKNHYHQQPLKHKKGKENFRQTVANWWHVGPMVPPEELKMFSILDASIALAHQGMDATRGAGVYWIPLTLGCFTTTGCFTTIGRIKDVVHLWCISSWSSTPHLWGNRICFWALHRLF